MSTNGTELEKRLAGCINRAVDAAMTEVLLNYKNGISISKESIAANASEVVQEVLKAPD